MYQKQPSRGVLRKRYSENMQQIYWRTPMLKCDFNKIVRQLHWYECSPENLLPIFRTFFLRTPTEGCFWCMMELFCEDSSSRFLFVNYFDKKSLSWLLDRAFDTPLQRAPYRSSCPIFYKKGVLKNFAKFIEKHLYLSPFFNKVAGLRPATLMKKRFRRKCFHVLFE